MTCPTCKGRCCVNKHGSPAEHGAALALHSCPDCHDGAYEICSEPEPFVRERSFKDERADVLAFLAHAAAFPNPTLPLGHYIEMLAELIRDGEHVGASKKEKA